MRKILFQLLGILGFFLPNSLFAQNNLKIAFKDAASAPRNLVVCGDSAIVTVTISTEGANFAARQNIRATLNLFKGVEFVRFNAGGSSAGVSLLDGTNTSSPIFSVPSLSPIGVSSVNLSYVIKVNCAYTDTLTANDALSVFDTWQFNYDIGAQTNVTETDFSTEYRDQIKVPFFTMSVSNNTSNNARAGECYQRTILINNSGLEGWIRTFTYSNLQGAGIRVNRLRVNGQTVSFTKTPQTNGDTLITYDVPAALFAFNTRGLTDPADGDTLFEADETVTIIEDICVVDCDKSRTSSHTMNWGCESRACNTLNKADLVRIGEGSVIVGFTGSGVNPDTVGGYCVSGRSTVTYTNNGVEIDPGTATLYNLTAGIGLGGSFGMTYGGYSITSLKIAGVSIPLIDTAIIQIGDNPLFATDPDGAGVGLSDADGDGFFDDLPAGASIEMSVTYDVACSVGGTGENCVNDLEAGFSAMLEYSDNCLNRLTSSNPGYFTPFNGNDYFENCSDPDAFTDGTPFIIEHMERRNIFNFDKSCNGQEQFIVKIKVPNGIQAIQDSMSMARFTDTLRLLSLTQSNDTVTMVYDASGLPFLNGDYDLQFGFSANCSATPGATSFPTEITFFCPPCDCRHVWYCDTIEGPKVHYSTAACPPNPAYDCNTGLQTVSFDAVRTTMGYADAAYTTRIDPSVANTKVALTCDSVLMTVKNVVGATPISDSIGIRISYDNITYGDSNKLKDIFIFGKGTVQITHGGNTFTCNVDASKVRVVRSDSSKQIYLDISNCFADTGIPQLVAGDSVNFYGYFAVNSEGPIDYTFEKVPRFRAYGYYIDNGQENVCDDFGELFRLGRSEVLFSYPSSSSFPKGCNEANLEYKLLVRNNDYTKYFGQEYRQAVGIDSVVLRFDPNFIESFNTVVEVSIPGHPFAGAAFFPLSKLDSTGVYVARFDTLNVVPSLGQTSSYAFNFRIRATPNCQSLTGSSSGNNRFQVSPKIQYKDRFYANFIGDGSCTWQKTDTARTNDQFVTYTNPPVLSLTPVTSLTATTATDTAEWTLKICNTSEEGGAGTAWLSIEPDTTARNFRVLEMTDVTTPSTPINLRFTTYGNNNINAYTFTNGLTVATSDKSIDDFCNVIKVKALVADCGNTNVVFNTGWYCTAPDTTSWRPDNYTPCVDLSQNGGVELLTPFIDANFINQSLDIPQVCDTTTLEILLRNTDLGNVYNVRTQLTIPLEGTDLDLSNIEVAYPSGSAYRKVLGTPTLISTSQRGKVYEFANFSKVDSFLNNYGLKGFNPSNPNDSNEFKIRFRYVNDCKFKSGTLAYFSFLGESACGRSSNLEIGESLPLQINGATLDTPKLYRVSINTDNRFVGGGASKMEVKFRNMTAVPSDSRDRITVKLPSRIQYRSNTAISISPTNWTPGEPTIDSVGNVQILSWRHPVGLGAGEEAVLTFLVNAPDTLACTGDSREMSVVTTAQKSVFCASSGTTCELGVITTSGGENFFDIPLSTDSLSFTTNLRLKDGKYTVLLGDSVRFAGVGAAVYKWYIDSTNTLIDSSETLVFRPNLGQTRIRLTSGARCAIPVSFVVEAVRDTNPPIITLTTRDTSISCRDTFPLLRPIVTDDWDTATVVTYTDRLDSVGCTQRLTRTWTATDRSGNSATATQTISQVDLEAPRITPLSILLIGKNSGDTLTVNCQNVPTLSVNDMNFSDDCDTSLVKTLNINANTIGNCPVDGFISLTDYRWTARDKCGNTSEFRLFLKVVDVENPVLFNVPNDTAVLKAVNVPTVPNNVATTDNCDTDVTVAFTENATDRRVTRTWTATDDCGNRSTRTQIITILQPRDTTPPKIDPVDSTIINLNDGDTLVRACHLPLFFTLASVRVTDSLDANPTVQFDSTLVLSTDCVTDGYTSLKTYRWLATDSTGNSSQFRIHIRFIDTIPPDILDVPNDTIINSIDSLAAAATRAIDACTGANLNFTVRFDSIDGVDSIYVREWTATDECGNQSTARQIIRVVPIDTSYQPCGVFASNLLTIRQTNCAEPATVCTSILMSDRATYTFIDNGNLVTPNAPCDTLPDFLQLSFTTGYHQLIIRNDSLRCVDTMDVDVICSFFNTITQRDTIFVGDQTNYCLNRAGIGNNIASVRNYCTTTSNRNVEYALDSATNCLVLRGLKYGIDTACYVVCNDGKQCVQIQFYTVVKVKSTNDSVVIRIPVGGSDTVCFKRSNLPGDSVRLTQYCGVIDSFANYNFISSDTCILIRGFNTGISKACFQLCDTLGHCDTIRITTIVGDVRFPPIAVNDSAQTVKNQAVSIKFLLNDTINGTFKEARLLSEPIHGQVAIRDSNGVLQFIYTPNQDYCGKSKPDDFAYLLCNLDDCSQARVIVTVLCNGIKIFNGFSPNGDGFNDAFVIEGIDEFPNTSVLIYNRWGNLVYSSKDYKNDWKGEWNGGLVPDGTYFYHIRLESGERYTGYLQVQK